MKSSDLGSTHCTSYRGRWSAVGTVVKHCSGFSYATPVIYCTKQGRPLSGTKTPTRCCGCITLSRETHRPSPRSHDNRGPTKNNHQDKSRRRWWCETDTNDFLGSRKLWGKHLRSAVTVWICGLHHALITMGTQNRAYLVSYVQIMVG